MRELARASREIPAEVHLRAADPVALEGQDLRVAEAAAVGPRALVGHEHLVSDLDEPFEIERRDHLGVRPAALEVARAIDAHVGWAVEGEVVAQAPLDELAISELVGAVAV